MKTNSFANSTKSGTARHPIKVVCQTWTKTLFCMGLWLAMAFPIVIAAQSPSILVQPRSQSVWGGTELSLSVAATGGGKLSALPKIHSGTLKLWLTASDVVTNSVGLVSQWLDQSGNTNDAFQSDYAYKPSVVHPQGIGRQPAIRFNGSQNDYLQGVGDVDVPSAMTTFTVLNAFSSIYFVNMAWLIGVPGQYGYDRSETDYNGQRDFTTWNYGYTAPFTVPTNTYRIWADRIDTNLTTLELFDATLTDSTNFTTSMPPAGVPASGYYIGGLDPIYNQGWKFDGDIAEWIVYRGYLSEEDRLAVMNYLRQKYYQVGGSGLAYQWQFNGTNLLKETNSALNLAAIQASQAGTYCVVVSNSAGSEVSSNAIIEVELTPVIVSQPSNQLVFAGQPAAFSVAANGPVPLQYQWTFNGTNLAGATDSALTITNTQPSDVGTYAVILGTTPNLTISSNAVLSIYPMNEVITNLTENDLAIALQAGGTVTFTTNGVLMVSNTIIISNDVVLDGTGHSITLSGGSVVPLFAISPSVNITFRDLTLANGARIGGAPINGGSPLISDGGAISNNGNLTIETCIFSNNVVIGGSTLWGRGYIGYEGLGGAIYSTGQLFVTNSLFVSNVAVGATSGGLGAGGAIYSTGRLDITNSVFRCNTCYAGNPASTFGGAICNNGGILEVGGSTFSSNLANGNYNGGNGYGGAIYSFGSVFVASCLVLSKNGATGSGTPYEGPMTEYVNAGSAFGGAISVGGGTAFISNASFASNYALGGSTSEGAGGVGGGGGLFNAGSMELTQCTFQKNSSYGGSAGLYGFAQEGQGGAVFNSGNLKITSAAISSNSAIGASYSSQLGDNTAPGMGGGIYNDGVLRLFSSLISSNVAIGGRTQTVEGTLAVSEGYGGAIANIGSVQIETTVLSSNLVLNGPDIGDCIYNIGSIVTDSNTIVQPGVSVSPPFIYDWQINGANISDSSSSSFNLTNIQFNIAEVGSLNVSTPANSVTVTEIVSVTQSNAPLFVVQPKSESILLGANSPQLVAVAVSAPAPEYQWQLNGTNVAGANGTIISFPYAALGEIGTYTVIASNIYGIATSQPAALTMHSVGLTAENVGNGTFLINSDSGSPYVKVTLETSTNLLQWQPVTTNPSQVSFTDINASATPFRFYRTSSVPAPPP